MGRWMTGRLSLFALLSLALSLTSTPAKAEMYVAGQFGMTIPNSFSNVEVTATGVPNGTTFSDLDLKNSFMYGAKAGYYFDSIKWLGVETEVFNTNPHFKQQTATLTAPGFGSVQGVLTGQHVRVLNWAPVNIVVRHQMGQFEPYAGIGLGLFFAKISDGQTGESSSTTEPGLNAQLGARYYLAKNFTVFGEWKYNRANLNFSESSPTQATGGIKGDYSAHILAFGVGYHF
jgi:opacity protein-like surface antigen